MLACYETVKAGRAYKELLGISFKNGLEGGVKSGLL